MRADLLFQANRAAGLYWHQLLLSSDRALTFLRARGFDDPEGLAKKYGLGLAPSRQDGVAGLAEAVRSKVVGLESGNADPLDVFVRAGCLHQTDDGRFRDVMYDRVITPICSKGGLEEGLPGWRVAGFSGRRLRDGVDGPPKWLNTREGDVFQKRRLLYGLSWVPRGTRHFILVEGQFDLLRVREAGFGSAIASLGTSLTEFHLESLPASTKTKRVHITFCTDDDDAGVRSARRGAALVYEKRADVQVSLVSGLADLDPDDFIRAHGADAFRGLLARAESPLHHFLESRVPGRGEMRSLADVVETVLELARLIAPHPDDAMADLVTAAAWLQDNYGLRVPVHHLRSILKGRAGAEVTP